jgi:hypothetical protein
MTDIEIITGLDQPIPINAEPILQELDTFYLQHHKISDIKPILNKLKELVSGFRSRGLGLTKLLYLLHRDWADYGIE